MVTKATATGPTAEITTAKASMRAAVVMSSWRAAAAAVPSETSSEASSEASSETTASRAAAHVGLVVSASASASTEMRTVGVAASRSHSEEAARGRLTADAVA